MISSQWHVLVLTLRLAVCTLFGKTRSNLSKNFLHPQKYALPYTYGYIHTYICAFMLSYVLTMPRESEYVT